MITTLGILLFSVFLTILLVPSLGNLAIRFNAVDLPNERKVHTVPVPRIGGLAMAFGIFLPLILLTEPSRFMVSYLSGAAVLVLVGLIDDFRDLSPRIKFTGQIVAALIAVGPGNVCIRSLGTLLPEGWLLPVWLAVPLTLFVIVGVTNAINLADGLDGLAGGISLMVVIGIGYLAYTVGDHGVALICLALGGALFGFLRFNTHPATIFMGDSGSQLLGYSVAMLSISLTQQHGAFSPLLPLLLAGVPILDTLTVMISRIAKGQSPFAADKNHLHHNLMRLGLHHPESVLLIYVLQAILIFSATLLRFYSDWMLLGGYLIFCGSLLWALHTAERTGWRPVGIERYNSRIAVTLRYWKRQGKLISIMFPFFKYGLPLLLILAASMAREVPESVKLGAALLALISVLVLTLAVRHLPQVIHVITYLLVPCVVYYSDRFHAASLSAPFLTIYNIVFGLFALLMIMISKLSRRSGGFKSTPLDFLVLMLAVAMPFLPVQHTDNHLIGVMAVKIILLYFCFEVLFAELRRDWKQVTILNVVALLMLTFR